MRRFSKVEYFLGFFFPCCFRSLKLKLFFFFNEKLCACNGVYRSGLAQQYIFVMGYTVTLKGSCNEIMMNYIYLTCTVMGLDIK